MIGTSVGESKLGGGVRCLFLVEATWPKWKHQSVLVKDVFFFFITLSSFELLSC